MKKIILIISVVVLCAACENKTKDANPKIATQSEVLVQYNDITTIMEQDSMPVEDVKVFISNVLTYSEANPEDPTTPELLLKAGILSTTLAKLSNHSEEKAHAANQAIELFSKVEEVYPESNDAKESTLNKAFVYDEVLQDYNSAESVYRDFVHRYPNDSVSIHLKTYIEMLGKSPEEIMEEIRKKEDL